MAVNLDFMVGFYITVVTCNAHAAAVCLFRTLDCETHYPYKYTYICIAFAGRTIIRRLVRV